MYARVKLVHLMRKTHARTRDNPIGRDHVRQYRQSVPDYRNGCTSYACMVASVQYKEVAIARAYLIRLYLAGSLQ